MNTPTVYEIDGKWIDFLLQNCSTKRIQLEACKFILRLWQYGTRVCTFVYDNLCKNSLIATRMSKDNLQNVCNISAKFQFNLQNVCNVSAKFQFNFQNVLTSAKSVSSSKYVNISTRFQFNLQNVLTSAKFHFKLQNVLKVSAERSWWHSSSCLVFFATIHVPNMSHVYLRYAGANPLSVNVTHQ